MEESKEKPPPAAPVSEDVDAAVAASLATEDADAARRRETEDSEVARALAESERGVAAAPAESSETGALAAQLREIEERGRRAAKLRAELAEEEKSAAEQARQLRERMASQPSEKDRLRAENARLRADIEELQLRQALSEVIGTGTVTPDRYVAPEGYGVVAWLLADEGLSGLLGTFVENEIDDDALEFVSVQDVVEVGVPPAAARRILRTSAGIIRRKLLRAFSLSTQSGYPTGASKL